jgi:hypothetical protein
LAAGKPISISLKPSFTKNKKKSNFCDKFMGISRLWLPSRKSTEAQTGAAFISLFGHRLSCFLYMGNCL